MLICYRPNARFSFKFLLLVIRAWGVIQIQSSARICVSNLSFGPYSYDKYSDHKKSQIWDLCAQKSVLYKMSACRLCWKENYLIDFYQICKIHINRCSRKMFEHFKNLLILVKKFEKFYIFLNM